MAVSVGRGTLSRIVEDPTAIVLQVQRPSDPDAAAAALEHAAHSFLQLDPQFVGDVARTPAGPFMSWTPVAVQRLPAVPSPHRGPLPRGCRGHRGGGGRPASPWAKLWSSSRRSGAGPVSPAWWPASPAPTTPPPAPPGEEPRGGAPMHAQVRRAPRGTAQRGRTEWRVVHVSPGRCRWRPRGQRSGPRRHRRTLQEHGSQPGRRGELRLHQRRSQVLGLQGGYAGHRVGDNRWRAARVHLEEYEEPSSPDYPANEGSTP